MFLSDYFSSDSILKDTAFDRLCLSNSPPCGKGLSFLEDLRFLDELNENRGIAAVICTADVVEHLSAHIQGVVVSEQPRISFFRLHNRLSQDPAYAPPLSPTKMGRGCVVSPLAVIDPLGVELGEHVVIEEFVVIHGPCRIGDNTVIHSGVKIGEAGFESKRLEEGMLDVAHCGSVEIGHDVVIWENSSVHRALYPWDSTKIGNYVRINAHCHIDHGAKIGDYSKLCAGAIISGRTEIGASAYIGPGAVVSNRLNLGDKARASIGSVVTRDIAEGKTVSGNFAIDHRQFLDHLRKIRGSR